MKFEGLPSIFFKKKIKIKGFASNRKANYLQWLSKTGENESDSPYPEN